MVFYTGHAHPLILSLTVLGVQHQLSGTHCLLLLGLLIALVLFGLDLKLTYSQKPMPPSVYLYPSASDSAPDTGAL